MNNASGVSRSHSDDGYPDEKPGPGSSLPSSSSCTTTSSSSLSSSSALPRNLTGINLPEKIIFVIDTVREKNCTPFKLTTGAKYTPLFMTKRGVENFVCVKSTVQRKHEYAIMTLSSQGSRWVCDFTGNTKTIVEHLDAIEEDTTEQEHPDYDLGQLFDKIQSNVTFPVTKQNMFVVRVILLYARSNTVPRFITSRKSFDNLTDNRFFFIDVLYIHEPPSTDNLCEQIYAEIAKLDTANYSYILEVGKTAAKLHDSMGKFLAHPLQRPPQEDLCYLVYSLLNFEDTCRIALPSDDTW